MRTSPGEARAGAEVLPELITFGEGTAPGARTAADLLSARQEIDDTWGLLVAASGGLALVLGASGIVFALWASVLARTSEIGVRRALGATRRDVTVQFLLETALIGVGAAIVGASIGPAAAAIVGASIGPAAAVLIAGYNGWPVVVDWLLVLATTSLAVELTVFAGLAPAMRAARQEPLGALRT